MSIIFQEATKVFHLQTGYTSYIMQIYKEGYLAHLYWGRRIRETISNDFLSLKERNSFSANPDNEDNAFTLDTLPQEYPTINRID